MKCFQYTLNQNNQGPAGILPEGSLTGLFHDSKYYGAALIDDLNSLLAWNAVEISISEFNTLFSSENSDPILVQLEPYVRKKYGNMMETLVKPYLFQERETWFIQVEESMIYQKNPSINISEIPLISSIATERQIPVATLVDTVLQKNSEYRSQIGTILGKQQDLINQLWIKNDISDAKLQKITDLTSEKNNLINQLQNPTDPAEIIYTEMLETYLQNLITEINTFTTQEELNSLTIQWPVFGA